MTAAGGQVTYISGCGPDHNRYTGPYFCHFSELARPLVKRSIINPFGYFHLGPVIGLLCERTPELHVDRKTVVKVRDVR